MDAAKHRAEEQEQQRRQQCEQSRQEEKEARQEELAIRSVLRVHAGAPTHCTVWHRISRPRCSTCCRLICALRLQLPCFPCCLSSQAG